MAFATQGPGSGDAERLAAVVAGSEATLHAFDVAHKRRAGAEVVRRIGRERPALVVMEGTGVAGGLALLTARARFHTRYVVSTGDAVGPFLGAMRRPLGPPGTAYERALYAASAGVIGWTPYLAGRALTLGAPRAMTLPGWAPQDWPGPESADWEGLRADGRAALGLADDQVAFGIVGSLNWVPRIGYCYGLELVEAARRAGAGGRWVVVIVGDGTGRERLQRIVADAGLGDRVRFTGHVARERLPSLLAAMDVGSLPQSVDRVGSFRYSIKLPEYLHAGLPIVTGQIPLAYDLDEGFLWRLRGAAPWDPVYLEELASLLRGATPAEVRRRAERVPRRAPAFRREPQLARATAFLADIAAA